MIILDDLPEVGLRAKWCTEAEWRDMLLVSLPGHRVSIDRLHIDGALGELALHLYHQGIFVLPPDATQADLLEAAAEVARELANSEMQPNFGPN